MVGFSDAKEFAEKHKKIVLIGGIGIAAAALVVNFLNGKNSTTATAATATAPANVPNTIVITPPNHKRICYTYSYYYSCCSYY